MKATLNYKKGYFIWKESGYDAGKQFKSEDLANKHAAKMKITDYEVRVVYSMSR